MSDDYSAPFCSECGSEDLGCNKCHGVIEAALRKLAEGIRDRYVKHLPGIEKPRCTLCGADEGSTHSTEFNCGQADAGLRAIPRRPL